MPAFLMFWFLASFIRIRDLNALNALRASGEGDLARERGSSTFALKASGYLRLA